jgi:hypothetical protein
MKASVAPKCHSKLPGHPRRTVGHRSRRRQTQPRGQRERFAPRPKRWVVQQVNGTLIPDRHLVCEYDHRPENAASRGYWAATADMGLRLTAHRSAWRTYASRPCDRRRPPSPPAGRTQRSRGTCRQGRRRRHEQPHRPPGRPERHHGRRRARPLTSQLHSAQAASGAGFTYPASFPVVRSAFFRCRKPAGRSASGEGQEVRMPGPAADRRGSEDGPPAFPTTVGSGRVDVAVAAVRGNADSGRSALRSARRSGLGVHAGLRFSSARPSAPRAQGARRSGWCGRQHR